MSPINSSEVGDSRFGSAAEGRCPGSRLIAFCSTIPGVSLVQYLFMLKIGKSKWFSPICGVSYVFQIISCFSDYLVLSFIYCSLLPTFPLKRLLSFFEVLKCAEDTHGCSNADSWCWQRFWFRLFGAEPEDLRFWQFL